MECMAMRRRGGLRDPTSCPDPECLPVLGFSDRETVKLDFDNTPFKNVRYWAVRAYNWFHLEGFWILRSSKNSYHVVARALRVFLYRILGI